MVAKLPAIDSLKTNPKGLTFLNTIDIGYYALFYLTAWLCFFLLYKISKYLHYKCNPHWFSRLDDITRKKWIAASISNLHSILVVTAVSYIFTHSICDNPYAFIWFYDDTCFLTMDTRFVYCSLMSAAYLSHDLWHLTFVIRSKGKTSK